MAGPLELRLEPPDLGSFEEFRRLHEECRARITRTLLGPAADRLVGRTVVVIGTEPDEE